MDVKEVYVSRKFPVGQFNMLEIGYHATIEKEEIRMTVVDKLVMEIEAYHKIYMGKNREESEVVEAKAGVADNVTILEPQVQLPNDNTERIRKVKAGLSDNQLKMVSIYVENNCVIVKPRQFLGSEDFAKIGSSIRKMGGEYISAGRDSHFRIPK